MISSLMSRMHKPIYEHRMKVLVDEIVPRLLAGDAVLDVGCGNGTLGAAIMSDRRCPAGAKVEGLERVVRGGEPIKVHAYDGKTMPLADKSVDVVIVADVLHHEEQPDRLLRECVRVSRRLVIIKDHKVRGPVSKARVSLMDWAANAPYGVPCLFRYNTLEQWRAEPAKFGATIEHERTSMDLYPGLWNPVFGKGLQYMAFWRTDKSNA
ncbi:MAG: class I SAM-dependent methyltransferase [Phycisphaerales bacterium]